jgi:hypothetical protein
MQKHSRHIAPRRKRYELGCGGPNERGEFGGCYYRASYPSRFQGTMAFVVNSKDAWNRKTHFLGARVRLPYVYLIFKFRFPLFLARR